jgi:hypothetical protein
MTQVVRSNLESVRGSEEVGRSARQREGIEETPRLWLDRSASADLPSTEHSESQCERLGHQGEMHNIWPLRDQLLLHRLEQLARNGMETGLHSRQRRRDTEVQRKATRG